jgi:hypothetical protein
MPVGHMRAGKNGRVQVAGTNLRNANWRANWKGDDLDTTNFEALTEQGLTGVLVCEWQTGGPWDAQQNNFDSPPGLYPRDDLGAVKFFEAVSDNVLHNLAANRVLSSENSAEVRGLVQFNASGKSNGVSFSGSLPTGSV